MIRMNDVKSSSISKIGYDPTVREMAITFTSGATYIYREVSLLDFAEFMNAESKGKHFHNYIKPYYEGKIMMEF